MMTTENKKIIYESPDGGQTVYAREKGSTEKTLHSIKDEGAWARRNRFLKWTSILSEAENNLPLQNLLNQAEALYELTRSHE